MAIYRMILALVAERRGIEFERSRLLAWMHGRSLFRELDALSVIDYATRRLGMAPRDVRESLSLQMDLTTLPQLSGAWLHHAERAPLKRLEVEIDLHLAMQSVMSRQQYLDMTDGLPKPELPTERLLLDWQTFFGLRGASDRSEGETPDPQPTHPAADSRADLSVSAHQDHHVPVLAAPLTFSMPREAARVVRLALRGVMDALGLPDEGAAFHRMLIEFIHEHAQLETLPEVRRRHRVFSRDGMKGQLDGPRPIPPRNIPWGIRSHPIDAWVAWTGRTGAEDPS